MKTTFFSISFVIALGIAGIALFSGCAGEAKNAVTGGAKGATAAKEPANNTNATAPKVVRAVFRVDANSRDPFFPEAKKATGASIAATEPKVVLENIGELLRAGFQGVGLSGDKRIAIINNVLLEPGKQASVPVLSGKQERRVSVRCREISRSAVVLEVEGVAEPVVISREQQT